MSAAPQRAHSAAAPGGSSGSRCTRPHVSHAMRDTAGWYILGQWTSGSSSSCSATSGGASGPYTSPTSRQMLAAEALGYQSVWIAEHHFNDYGLCPAPQVLAAFVAARTTTLRLGMGVSLLPLHHPVDLAEELAVLDVVSGGRLDIGIGRGGTLQDYETFQSDRADSRARVEEGIALMRHAWSGAQFDFRGRFHSADRLHVRPRPVQRPHPPLFIAANSEESVLSAARLGLPTLSSFFVPAPELH